MPAKGWKKEKPKSEFLQIRVTPEEKEMIKNLVEEFDFESVTEMIITFLSIKNESLKRIKGEKMNILKLEPGDIIVHELFGDLTILQRDIKNERYLVVLEDYKNIIDPQWIYFKEVEEVYEIKK